MLQCKGELRIGKKGVRAQQSVYEILIYEGLLEDFIKRGGIVTERLEDGSVRVIEHLEYSSPTVKDKDKDKDTYKDKDKDPASLDSHSEWDYIGSLSQPGGAE
jgi:hypothetical protein